MSLRFGKYQLLKQLAMGGMAEIWLARQQGSHGFEKLVVVKRILPHLAKNREFVEMFLDEARLSVQLSHPGVAQIYDLGEADGSFFIAMEYVHGENLAVVARRHQKRIGPGLPPHVAAHLAARSAEALHHAHTRSDLRGRPLEIVHRDVSPQNILLGYDGLVKVVDFGIAKARSRMTHTRTGVLKGKYSYMSPEQCRGQDLDGRSDQFALGIVLWELLTGRRLYKHESELMILQAICNEPPPPPREYVPDLDPDLEAIVLRALATDRDDRYPDCGALQVALDGWIHRAAQPVLGPDLGDLMRALFPDRLDAWSEVIEDIEKESSFGSEVFDGHSELFTGNTPTPSSALPDAADPERTPVEGLARRSRPGTGAASPEPPPPERPDEAPAERGSPVAGPGEPPPQPGQPDGAQPGRQRSRVARSPASEVPRTQAPAGARLEPKSPRGERPVAAPDPREISERYAAMPEVAPPLPEDAPQPKRRVTGTFPAPSAAGGGAEPKTSSRDRAQEPEASTEPPAASPSATVPSAAPKRREAGRPERPARAGRSGGGAFRTLRRILATLLTLAFIGGSVTVAWLVFSKLVVLSEQETALLEITSRPEGAEVLVDGRPVGVTPLSHRERDGRAEAEVQVTHPDYRAETRVVDLSPGRTERLEVTLRRRKQSRAPAPRKAPEAGAEPGLLTVEARPPCRLAVNGRDRGDSPLTRLSLPPGSHEVSCRHPELGVRRLTVEVPSGREVERFILFDGRLNVVARPWAEVHVDGKRIGTTPFEPQTLSPGTHQVRLTNRDHGFEEIYRVEIEPGRTATLDVDVDP